MLNLPITRMFSFSILSILGMGMSQCPEKISSKLCAQFLAAADTSYLQVRIVLDALHEGTSTFDKTKPPVARPLRTWTEELISTFDLRQLDHPESTYVRMYSAQDLSPAVDVVAYHNASVTKANLMGVISKAYVLIVEPPCWRMGVSFCEEINSRSDSSSLYFSIYFMGALETDTVAQKALLSHYPIKDSVISATHCVGKGYAANPPAIRSLGKESVNVHLDTGEIGCIDQLIEHGPKAGTISAPHVPLHPLSTYRCDGRLRTSGKNPPK